jgi:hypothetical protein
VVGEFGKKFFEDKEKEQVKEQVGSVLDHGPARSAWPPKNAILRYRIVWRAGYQICAMAKAAIKAATKVMESFFRSGARIGTMNLRETVENSFGCGVSSSHRVKTRC